MTSKKLTINDYFNPYVIVMIFGLVISFIGFVFLHDEALRGFGIGMIFATFFLTSRSRTLFSHGLKAVVSQPKGLIEW